MPEKCLSFFSKNGAPLLNTFKIFINEEFPVPHDIICNQSEGHGPPGHQFVLNKITKEVGEEIPLPGREWAMRMIFANLVHQGVASNSPVMKMKRENCPHLDLPAIKIAVELHANAIIEYLKNHPKDSWEVFT